MLKWPINFYFVKFCLFILVLSLTRNVSYFTEEIPEDFLATSTVLVQYYIRNSLNRNRDQLLLLPITNIFFSQEIDTNNSSIIWEKLLGTGLFSRIASAEHVSSLEDVNFYDTFQSILAFFDHEIFNYSEIFMIIFYYHSIYLLATY